MKPILGCELYICKKEDHRAAPEGDSYNHLIVLAENDEGYRNLVKIVSEASLHGFYYKPRISKKFLAEHSKGLIGLSACLKGEVAEELVGREVREARGRLPPPSTTSSARAISISRSRTRACRKRQRIQANLLKLEQELGIPLVATNDSHYLCEDDSHAQDVMVCIQTGKSINDTNRLKFANNQFFVKSAGRDGEGLLRLRARAGAHHGNCRALQRRLKKVHDPFPQVRCSRRLLTA